MSEAARDLLQSTFEHDGIPRACESSELLVRAQRGDPQAVNALLDRYQERVRRIVRVQLGSRLRSLMESMDIVQETLHQAGRDLVRNPDLETGNLLRWLSRIAVNRIRDANDHHFAGRRDRGRDLALADAGEGAPEAPRPEPAAAQTAPDERAFKGEVRELLDDAIARLPEDDRQVILLRDYCGEDWEHIAKELDRPSTHAARQLHQRAWIRVRQSLWPRLRDSR